MKNLKKLTLLHSNDMHGDFLADSVDEKLLGGVSMLSGYVNKTRREEKNVIYTISGDMFRGSVIDAEFKGVSTIEIMNMLAPDVVTLGNHEIDYGIAHLLFIEKCAKFPIINANLFISTNHARLFRPHFLMEIGGMKVLFIGIITEDVLAQTKQDTLIGSFVNIFEVAAEVEKICDSYKATDIDLTVLLTHIGFEEDKRLAAELSPDLGIDLIIGGHSHTILSRPERVNGILIAQAGTGTDQIGRFDLMIDTDTNSIDSFKWELVPIDGSHCPRDAALEEVIMKYKTHTDAKYGRIVTKLLRQLTHPERTRETEVGNLFSDILKISLGVDIVLLGSGSIRNEYFGPVVEYGELTEIFPYDDSVYLLKVTGAQLKRMVKHILRDEAFAGHTEFYQFSSGVEIEYSRGKRELTKLNFCGKPVEDARIYKLALQKFHYINIESFLGVNEAEIADNGKITTIATSVRNILEEYLTTHQNLDAHIEGRLVVK